MTCAEFDRWLDAGSPEPAAGEAAAHARGCPSCAGALRASRAVEVALRTAPRALAGPSEGFVSRVMSQVAAAPRISEVAAAARQREATRHRWLFELASDPVGAVSLTIAIAIGLAALWRPDGTTTVASTLVASSLRWLGAAVSEPVAAITRAFDGGLDPIVRISIAFVAGSCGLWAGFAIYRRLERVIVLLGGGRSV